MARIVLMSGYPGSGKSTLGRQLAEALGFAFISKDELLHTIFTALGGQPGDHDLSFRSGAAARGVFWQLAGSCPDVVLDSNIKFADPFERAQAAKLTGKIVEVRCCVPRALAQARYADRAAARGHPAQRDLALPDARAALYDHPIGVGKLLEVDTSAAIDVAAVVSQVRRLLEMA